MRAMVWFGCIAPVDDNSANDHQVFKDDGEVCAATVGAEHAELLVQRTLPNQLCQFHR